MSPPRRGSKERQIRCQAGGTTKGKPIANLAEELGIKQTLEDLDRTLVMANGVDGCTQMIRWDDQSTPEEGDKDRDSIYRRR